MFFSIEKTSFLFKKLMVTFSFSLGFEVVPQLSDFPLHCHLDFRYLVLFSPPLIHVFLLLFHSVLRGSSLDPFRRWKNGGLFLSPRKRRKGWLMLKMRYVMTNRFKGL